MKLIISGIGVVGRALLNFLKNDKRFIVCGIVKSDGALYNPDGLNLKYLHIKSSSSLKEHANWHDSMTTTDIISEAECNCLVELTPTNLDTGQPATENIITAIETGMDVVSANKAPFALYYKKIFSLADETQRLVKYEATVGGAVPSIDIKKYFFLNDNLEYIKGILNGTTNFILHTMETSKVELRLAIEEAKARGYTEKDPSQDISGMDAAAKAVILANTFFDTDITIKQAKIIGIDRISYEAIELASEEGKVIKQIAFTDGNTVEVSPYLIEQTDSLNVSGNLNAIKYKYSSSGEITLIGKGAGGVPTAATVYSNIISIYNSRRKIETP